MSRASKGEVVYSINRKNTSNNTDNVELMNSNERENNAPINILCITCKNSKMGAAYYEFDTKLLYVYEEILDVAPQFLVSCSLYREVNPKYTLSFGNTTDDFIKILIDVATNNEDTTVTSDSVRSLPPNFTLLPMKEYPYDVCKILASELTLASNAEESCQVKKQLFIHSLINFDNRSSIHALGALVKYLDKNWAFFSQDRDELVFLHINQVSLKTRIFMDNTSFNALQVFHQRSHDSCFKRGLQSSSKEGLSIFKLLSTNCKSKLGLISLKKILGNPINDFKELNKRLDFINFVLQPTNKEFVESLQDNIKELGDINLIFVKIQNSRANSRDWNVLYKTIYHTIFINVLSGPYRKKSPLINDLCNSVTSDLIGLEESIDNALDFSTGLNRNRPVIKFGLDSILDAKKLREQDISKHLKAASYLALNELPDFLTECAVVYMPEMGHLIAIQEWEPNCDRDQFQNLGYQFMFSYEGTIHYKSPLCVELDKSLGDLKGEIIDHENRIVRRLSGFVLKFNKDIRDPLEVIALMDCLISMAQISMKNNYVCPKLNSNNIHEIKECRHLLMELINPTSRFEPNNFYSGGDHSRMKIITGPNGSGKSIYLKQIALVVYLAHVGCFVPAKSANIGMVHSIHSRMYATESACVRLSSFMIDITQATAALHNAQPSSFIIIDEFGRGTTGEEGIALLVGVLKKFLHMEQFCSNVLVSTHFQQIATYLPESKIVEHLRLEHTMQEGEICFLYKIVKGVSQSYTFEIAAAAGFDEDILTRAKEIYHCLKTNQTIRPVITNSNNRFLNVVRENVDQFLLDLEMPNLDE